MAVKLMVRWETTVTERYEREIEIESLDDLTFAMNDDQAAKLRSGDLSPLSGECYGDWDGIVAAHEGRCEYVSTQSREVEFVERTDAEPYCGQCFDYHWPQTPHSVA